MVLGISQSSFTRLVLFIPEEVVLHAYSQVGICGLWTLLYPNVPGFSSIYNTKHMCLPGGPALAINFKRLLCSPEVCVQVFQRWIYLLFWQYNYLGYFCLLHQLLQSVRVTYVQKKKMCSTTISFPYDLCMPGFSMTIYRLDLGLFAPFSLASSTEATAE